MKTRPPRSRPPVMFLTGLLVLTGPVLRGAEKVPPPPPVESIEMPKMRVKGHAACSFGFGLVGTRDPATKKISRLFISAVTPGSEAERRGLKVDDEILAINGEKVAGMDGWVRPGSRLFDLLVDQVPGETIELELAVRTKRTLTLQASPEEDPHDSGRRR